MHYEFVKEVNCFIFHDRKSLNLVETLLRLAEAGHFENVKNLFSFPFKNCPDILLFALLQINVSNLFINNNLVT
jgi:CCR4-NOT transcription complex subunit 1